MATKRKEGARIAIVGSAPSSRLDAPYGDQAWEIWALSPTNIDLPRIDVFFEVHDDAELRRVGHDFIAWLNAFDPARLMLMHAAETVPHGVRGWDRELRERYPSDFLSSSIAWMIAKAIEREPAEIGLWGVDMAADEEYGYQRNGCLFLLWVAEHLHNIKITIPLGSTLSAQRPVYPDHALNPMRVGLLKKREFMQRQLDTILGTMTGLEQQRDQLRGAISQIDWTLTNYC